MKLAILFHVTGSLSFLQNQDIIPNQTKARQNDVIYLDNWQEPFAQTNYILLLSSSTIISTT